jgi:DNA-binding CsgD family transcriptional regulator
MNEHGVKVNERHGADELPYPLYVVDARLRVFWANAAGEEYAGHAKALSMREAMFCKYVLRCAFRQDEVVSQSEACDACELRGAVVSASSAASVRRLVVLKRTDESGHRDQKLLVSASKIKNPGRVLLSVEEVDAIPGLGPVFEEVERNRKELAELKTTIGMLLEKQAEAKRHLSHRIALNLCKTLRPCLDQLEGNLVTSDQVQCARQLRARLSTAVMPFLGALTSMPADLTSREAQVADLILKGKKTREIASQLGCSKRAVEFHRDSLRQKLNVKNRKANLRHTLLQLGAEGSPPYGDNLG